VFLGLFVAAGAGVEIAMAAGGVVFWTWLSAVHVRAIAATMESV
jgi:hypothetical protein